MSDYTILALGEALRDLRLRHGLTLEDLAIRTGYDPTSLHRLERGHRVNIDLAMLRTVLAVYGRTAEVRLIRMHEEEEERGWTSY